MPGLYGRTISIYRPTPVEAAPVSGAGQGIQVGQVAQPQLQVGNIGYEGLSSSNEALIWTDVACSIQAEALGNAKLGEIPSDSPGSRLWNLPRAA